MASLKSKNDKIYDSIRKKWVEPTPEELIRQRLIRYMIDKLGYLPSLIAIEKQLAQLPHLHATPLAKIANRRLDVVVFAKGTLLPLLLIECKAVPLTPAFAQQVIGYNAYVRAPYIALANEKQILTGYYCEEKGVYRFESGLPTFETLMLEAFKTAPLEFS